MTETFSGCAALTTVEVDLVESILPGAFQGCYSLVTLKTGGSAAAKLARGLDNGACAASVEQERATDAADAAVVKTFVEAAVSAGEATRQAVQQAWLNSAYNGCSA